MKKHVKAKKSLWKMGCLAAVSLVWLIIRTGRKPTRITYPCQKAAVASIHIFLLALLAPLLDFGRFKTTLPHALNSRLATTVLLVSSLLLAFGSVAITGNYIPIESSFVPVPLDLQTHNAVTSTNSSDLFFVQNASGAEGNMDGALSSLLQLMADHSLSFFKTANQPYGLVGKDDVIILKVNSQWAQRGGTNTDLVKSIVKKIVNHPEGFTGEIIIADNGQWMARTDQSQWWTENNAYNHSQSMISVAQAFPSHKISTWLWDIINSNSVSEYDQGDFTDGYVVSPTADPVTHIQASYPKFKTKYNTYVSLKNGIWNIATSTYNSGKLKLINIPVLKSHEGFGVTGCIKHYMGVLSNSLTNGHGTIAYGSMGTVMAETRFPTLNILDAIWVNANPIESSGACGPSTSYSAASYTNAIGASQDPVALDYWASKHILIPTAVAKGYTAYSSLDPDYEPVTSPLTESFHNYLERSTYELKKNGFQVTMNEDEMNIYVSSTSGELIEEARPSDVIASSYGEGHQPSFAVDGIEDPSNYWGTNALVPEGRVPQWLNVDLGSPLTIVEITTHFWDGDARTYTYYVEVSNDSSSWITIVPTKTGSGSVTDTFPRVKARFVRTTITANTANPAAHIEEIKIYRLILPSDLNKDGIINILDISIVAIAFNSVPGKINWNPVADLDGNGIVSIIDVSKVAIEYRRTV